MYLPIIAFSLTQVKYGTLTIRQRRLCGIVVKTRVYQVSRSGSNSDAFFYSFFSELCIRVRVRAAMPAQNIATRNTKKEGTLCNYAFQCIHVDQIKFDLSTL